MRIIAGAFRGRVLKSPMGRECRPAMGRTREALFSMLEARGVDWGTSRVLDVFAGSGSLAFEAVSRGAPEAVLLESSKTVLAALEANVRSLDLGGRVRIEKDDALRVLRKGTTRGFSVAFLDPPYRKDYAAKCLPLLAKNGWLLPGAYLLLEIEHDLVLTPDKDYLLETERLFGQTKVLFLRFAPEA